MTSQITGYQSKQTCKKTWNNVYSMMYISCIPKENKYSVKTVSESSSCFLSSSSFEGYLETVLTVLWRSNQGYVVIGSCGNDDWAVSRAADCTPETMTMVVRVAETLKGPSAEPPTTPCWHWRSTDAEFDEGCQQSRRLYPDDSEDGEGDGDKGP